MTHGTCSSCGSSDGNRAIGGADSCVQCGAIAEPEASPAITDVADPLEADLRLAFGFDGPGSAHSSEPWKARRGGSHLPWEEQTLAVGSQLADFQVVSELGRGGMGIVYRAQQVSLGRQVALKVLPHLARHGRAAIERFRQEAQAAARINHANVVPVYAQGEHEGHYYYAMKLVRGEDVAAVIRSNPQLLSSAHASISSKTSGGFSWHQGDSSSVAGSSVGKPAYGSTGATETSESHGDTASVDNAGRTESFRSLADYRHIAGLLAGVAEGLAHAHAEGVVHRDIKPHNLILSEDNRIYITDFGLARLADQPHLTISGEVMGTPSYLSPEQARGETSAVDHRSDIYSLGVTLYEIITGRRPFEGESREQIIRAVCDVEPKRPRQIVPGLPRDLETICLRSIRKDARERYASAEAQAEDLRRFAGGRPILSRRVGVIERAGKWVRRHKAMASAFALTMGLVVVSTGWALSAASARHQEALDLIQGAYQQLAQVNYRDVAAVADDVAAAVELGAAEEDLRLVRALMAIGTGDAGAAVASLDQRLVEVPTDAEAAYLRSWALWRNRSFEASRAAIAEADAAGGPPSAEAWLFRGLAMHRDNAPEAIVSYQNSVSLAGDRGAFFPQSEINLARARNQRMARTHTLEGFDESEAKLRSLIDSGHFEDLPYYLLSIAYRLAGEVYDSDSSIRDAATANDYFEKSLTVAREAQEIWPTRVRCFNAEGQCLESLRRYAEAADARTSAIVNGGGGAAAEEGYYFRWRLRYWLNEFDTAMADLQKLQSFREKQDYYHFVYPALVMVETGDLDGALTNVRTISERFPEQTQPTLLMASLLRIFGQGEEAAALLATLRSGIDFTKGVESPQTPEWFEAMYDYVSGDVTLESLETLAATTDEPWELLADVYFHAGAMALLERDAETAKARFWQSYRTYRGDWGTASVARAIVERLEQNPGWGG